MNDQSYNGTSETIEQWALALMLGTVFLALFHELVPLARYLKYAALPLLILLYIGALQDVRRPVLYRQPYTLPFLLLLLAYVVFLPRISFAGIKDMLFIACFLVFFVLFPNRRINTRLLNFAVFGVFGVLFLWRDRGALSLVESSALAESTLSMVFGLFAVFTLLKRQYFWFLLNLIALLISLKRVALLGLLAVLLVMILPKRMRKIVTSPVFACVINLAAIGILLALGGGMLDNFFLKHFDISIGSFVMGRNNFYAESTRQILADPVMVGLFGAGPGSAYSTLGNMAANLHSDVLKIFYEFGAIWFIVFFFALYAVPDWRLRVLALYLNVIFLTDNSLIYVDVMVFYMILAAQLMLPEPQVAATTVVGQDKRGVAHPAQ